MLKIGSPWRYPGESDALHFMVTDDAGNRRIKLKRTENAALYDFLVEHVGPAAHEDQTSN